MSLSTFCARWGLACGLATMLVTAGCSLCPEGSNLPGTGCGELRVAWPACRKLQPVEHTCRRDATGRLVVLIRIRNRSSSPYAADVMMEFRHQDDAAGGQCLAQRHVFPPRSVSPIEWTSYSPEATTYGITIGNGW
jgi:hypothetical protein